MARKQTTVEESALSREWWDAHALSLAISGAIDRAIDLGWTNVEAPLRLAFNESVRRQVPLLSNRSSDPEA